MRIHRTAATGLRTVATFEAAKGFLVMAAGVGLLSLLHQDVQQAAESAVRHLHLNPAHYYARAFIEAATRLTDTRLWLLACGAFAYALTRGVEAYGLWRARVWGEWLAILSGTLYLPIEIYALVHHATALKAAVLVITVGIVAYVAYVGLVRRSASRFARSSRARMRHGNGFPCVGTRPREWRHLRQSL